MISEGSFTQQLEDGKGGNASQTLPFANCAEEQTIWLERLATTMVYKHNACKQKSVIHWLLSCMFVHLVLGICNISAVD